jgi:UDP-N-acetyl-D-mannosaminuronate dehydrogenase
VTVFDSSDVKVDCVILVVAHDAFTMMNLEKLKRITNEKPVLIDIRGVFDGSKAVSEGFY